MGDRLPLPTLLSQALVAYTIEFDNESEHLLPHRTASHGSTAGPGPKPWLASLVMWSNCMKYIGPDGVQLGELERLARTRTNLAGMQRWGYVVVTPGPADRDPKRPGPEAVLRATAGGRRAQEIWAPLFGVIDRRWHERFGADAIAYLRTALSAVADHLVELPECLPILGYGLFSALTNAGDPQHWQPSGESTAQDSGANLPLSALLSRVLLAFALDYERVSNVALAIGANVLRVLDEEGVRVRDLPILTGVSKEAVAMSTGYLEKLGCVAIEPVAPPNRGQRVRVTTLGLAAQQAASRRLEAVEDQWQTHFGAAAVRAIRSSLEPLVGDGDAQSPLFAGLEPYSDGWRAAVRKPTTLPHFPMVLHRGGFPDGS